MRRPPINSPCRARTSRSSTRARRDSRPDCAPWPILQDVSTDLQIKNPQAQVQIDRERAARLGVTVQQIEEALYDAYGSRQVSTIYTDNNQYWVIQELLPEYQLDLSALRLLYIRSQQGTLVPLTSVATVTPGLGPLTVNHSGQLPSVTLSFNLAPNVALGAGVTEVQRAAQQILPSTISTASRAQRKRSRRANKACGSFCCSPWP